MESVKQWTNFVRRCLQVRLRQTEFDKFAAELFERHPINSEDLATLTVDLCPLGPKANANSIVDPLLLVYVETLLAADLVSSPDLLSAVFAKSKFALALKAAKTVNGEKDASTEAPKIEDDGSLAFQAVILQRVAKRFMSGRSPASVAEARSMIRVTSLWMLGMANALTSESLRQAMAGEIKQVHPHAMSAAEALALLVLAMAENTKLTTVLDKAIAKGRLEVLDRPSPSFISSLLVLEHLGDFAGQALGTSANQNSLPGLRKHVAHSLSLFIPALAHMGIQTHRLEAFQKDYSLIDPSISSMNATDEHGIDVKALQLQSIVDLPLMNSKAGPFVFINALLSSRPLTDDSVILNYLNTRYKGEIISLTSDLIVASFDVLASAYYRSETTQAMFPLRSFLLNKVPYLLSLLQGSLFQPMEDLITGALVRIDHTVFPTASFDLAAGSSPLADVRQEFLFACVLHHVIPRDAVQRILGEPPLSTPSSRGRYVKDDLIDQCTRHPERVDTFINELETPDGNAGAIVGAITDILQTLSTNKETMSLKGICNSLSKRPQALDIMLQFTSPASILQPLCQLLDTWRYEDDQGEYQPVYDEFAAVFLLVLAFVHRFELTYVDIGLVSTSFVAQFLDTGNKSCSTEELTVDQVKHLESWLLGLFNPEGISDEIMSHCRPQEFYLLVPTIFSMAVHACTQGVLPLDTLRQGFEYLLEPFLLPSLVGGINWIMDEFWIGLHTSPQFCPNLLQVLQRLTKVPSGAGEAQSMHGAIMNIVSTRVRFTLKAAQSQATAQKRQVPMQEISNYLSALESPLHPTRPAFGTESEQKAWLSNSGTFLGSIRASIQQLCYWSAGQPPPSYTHRHLITAVKFLGAHIVLQAIIEEVNAQTKLEIGSVALDVATALICAPTTGNSPIPIDWASSPLPAPVPQCAEANLRDLLREKFLEASDLADSDPDMAATIVRLHRRVEAQLAFEPMALQMPIPDLTNTAPDMMQAMQDINTDAIHDAAAAAAIGSIDESMNLGGDGGLNLGDAGMDMGSMDLGLGGGVEGVMENPDDDIFAGLELDADMTF